MKILYDHQIFNIQKYGGISRYFFELSKSKLYKGKIGVLHSDNEYYKKKFFLFYIYFFKNSNLINLLNGFYSTLLYLFGNFDIYHPTYYYSTFVLRHFKKIKKPIVITVHDMIHERLPEYFIDKKVIEDKKISILNADKIIAVSQSTKNDIISLYGVNSSKIQVIYHGSKLIKGKNSHYNLPSRYILFVGNRGLYKNFGLLASSFSIFSKKFKNYYLVCIGGGKFTDIEKLKLTELSIIDKCLHFNVRDSDIHYFYSKASIFVFPSLYEGFGIPILESFECKCPTLLSNIPVFREIASDGAEYFDPHSVSSLTDKLDLLSTMKDKSKLIKRALNRLKRFDWEFTRNETNNLYLDVLDSFKRNF
jgi:glycosyltransferase involved in cell wall biosynthesis